MSVAIAVSGLHQCPCGLRGRPESHRCLTSCYRGAAPAARQREAARMGNQSFFLRPFQVTDQQCGTDAIADAQHARHGIWCGSFQIVSGLGCPMSKRTPSQSQLCPATQRCARRIACRRYASSIEQSQLACGCMVSTVAAPPIWPMSQWLSTTLSRRVCKASNNGSNTRCPAPLSWLKRGPTS